MTEQPGDRLVQQLVWVHGMLRRDLRALRVLAAQVVDGAEPQAVRATIDSLRLRSPLWQLRVNCLRYCEFVHHHHGAESAMLFPALRQVDPDLGPTVDRLEADHLKVAELLDTVTAEADALDAEAGPVPETGPDARRRLVEALGQLDSHLLEHLDFEEESISPALRKLTGWA